MQSLVEVGLIIPLRQVIRWQLKVEVKGVCSHTYGCFCLEETGHSCVFGGETQPWMFLDCESKPGKVPRGPWSLRHRQYQTKRDRVPEPELDRESKCQVACDCAWRKQHQMP